MKHMAPKPCIARAPKLVFRSSFLLNGISFVVRGGGGGGRRRRFLILCSYSTVAQIRCTCADVQ